jgi:tRNA 2-thiouridine synthesizing protein A
VSTPPPSQAPSPALELDCRGMLCPAPIVELGRRYAEVGVGEVVAVVADDPAARYDVPAWCRMKGQEYAGEDTAADGVPRFLVRRTG